MFQRKYRVMVDNGIQYSTDDEVDAREKYAFFLERSQRTGTIVELVATLESNLPKKS